MRRVGEVSVPLLLLPMDRVAGLTASLSICTSSS